MVQEADPGADGVPARLVTTQPRVTVPLLPGVKVTRLVLAPEVMLPPPAVQL